MLSRRFASPSDVEFLWHLTVAAMRSYVEATYGWNETDQRRRFEETFRLDRIEILEKDGTRIGLWEVYKDRSPWFLARVAILPEHQRYGFGTKLVQDFLAEAAAHREAVVLQVLRVNPAKALYERLGFVVDEETATHFRMRKEPN